MIRVSIEVNNAKELKSELESLMFDTLSVVKAGDENEFVQADAVEEVQPVVKPVEEKKPEPVKEEKPADEIKPVITMDQAEEARAKAPVHEEPKQPTVEEARAALKALRDRKGADAVKRLLKGFGASSLTELKPEDYLGAIAQAEAEV